MMCGWSSQPTGMFVPKESKNHLKMYLQMDQNGMFVGCECFVAVFHSSSQSPKSTKINVRLAPLTTGLVLAPECSSTPGRVTAEAVIFFTNRNTKIWTSWLILLVRDSSSPKRWYTPNPLVCLISGQTHLVIHVPSFTSRSSEILLWCLFNIVTWGKKKYGCSHRTNRTQWCETASWKFRATVSGLHMASHVLCVEIWLQMHGIPVQVCPWNFESWGWLGGLGRWEQKKCFDSIPSIFMGSRACSLKGWKSLKVGWDPAQFEPDAMTCVIYVILQMPCIVYHGTSSKIYNFSRKRIWFGRKTSELGPWSPWNLMLGMLSKISGFHGSSEVVNWFPLGLPLNGSTRQLHITDLGHPETHHPSPGSTDPMMWKIDKSIKICSGMDGKRTGTGWELAGKWEMDGKPENWMDMVKLVGEVSSVWRTFRCFCTCLQWHRNCLFFALSLILVAAHPARRTESSTSDKANAHPVQWCGILLVTYWYILVPSSGHAKISAALQHIRKRR